MSTPFEENLAQDQVVISGGMADYIPESDTCLHDVFSRADGLMYERKKALKAKGARIRDENPETDTKEGDTDAEK